jgi:hypothetical protein
MKILKKEVTGRPRSRLKENIKMDVGEIGLKV